MRTLSDSAERRRVGGRCVSAALFPVSRAAGVTRDFRSCKTSTGRVRLQMMRSPSQWPASPRPSMVFGRSWIDARRPLYVCSWGTGSPRDGCPNRSSRDAIKGRKSPLNNLIMLKAQASPRPLCEGNELDRDEALLRCREVVGVI